MNDVPEAAKASLDSVVSVPDQVLFRDLDGEAVILSLDSGQYYGLDEVGTRMWVLLTEHGQVEQVYRVLLDEYEVSDTQLCRDLLGLVDELVACGLLRVDGG